jgi:hypothetical protein
MFRNRAIGSTEPIGSFGLTTLPKSHLESEAGQRLARFDSRGSAIGSGSGEAMRIGPLDRSLVEVDFFRRETVERPT